MIHIEIDLDKENMDVVVVLNVEDETIETLARVLVNALEQMESEVKRTSGVSLGIALGKVMVPFLLYPSLEGEEK